MQKYVKAANLHAVNDLRYEDVPLGECSDDEVTVEVKCCGICGSDIPRVFSKGTYRFPTVIGHEFCGKVTFDPKGEITSKNVAVFPLFAPPPPALAPEGMGRQQQAGAQRVYPRRRPFQH